MKNAEIAKILSTIADILELKGEGVFRVNASTTRNRSRSRAA